MLQTFSLRDTLAKATRRRPADDAIENTAGRSSCVVPYVSRRGDASSCHALANKEGGDSPISKMCELSPDLASKTIRLPASHSRGAGSARPPCQSPASVTTTLSPPSEGTTAQDSVRYLPEANSMKEPSGDHTGKAAPMSP